MQMYRNICTGKRTKKERWVSIMKNKEKKEVPLLFAARFAPGENQYLNEQGDEEFQKLLVDEAEQNLEEEK